MQWAPLTLNIIIIELLKGGYFINIYIVRKILLKIGIIFIS